MFDVELFYAEISNQYLQLVYLEVEEQRQG